MQYIKRMFRDVNPWLVISSLSFLVIWSLFQCAFSSLLAQMTAAAVEGNVNLMLLGIGYIVFILIWSATEYASDIIDEKVRTSISNNTYTHVSMAATETRTDVLKKSNTGYLAGLAVKMAQEGREVFYQTFVAGITALTYLIYFVIATGFYSPVFSILLIVFVMISILVRLAGYNVIKKRAENLAHVQASQTRLLMDSLGNIATVQRCRAQKFILNKMEIAGQDMMDAKIAWWQVNEFFMCSFKSICCMYLPACLIVIGLMGEVSFDIVEFFALLSLIAIQLVHQVKAFTQGMREFDAYKSTQQKVNEIIGKQNRRSEKEIETFETVEMKDIIYRYDDNTDTNIEIKIPYFKVNSGEHVMVSGESGQGKTTLLSMLAGEIGCDGIYVDGEKINERIKCTLIAQDTEMLDMSVRDNLCLGKEIDDDEILRLLEAVNLGEWLREQTDGLDTPLGEKGVFVSTGQRQRLNIVRGLLERDSPLVLLDEPTSNLDSLTEKKIVALLDEELAGRTTVIVSHREAVSSICDRQYIFENSIVREP